VAESIRLSELRKNNAEIMRRVAHGESFTVTVHGHAVADLVPHQRTTSRRRLVAAAELDEVLTASGPAPDPGRWAHDVNEAASSADYVAVSAVTVAEPEYGVGASADAEERLRRRRRLGTIVDAMDVIPLDIAVAGSYGLLANMVRAAGPNPRPRRLDLLIAATAERHGLGLATRDARDFRVLDRVVHVIEVR
jgi:toxin FitB